MALSLLSPISVNNLLDASFRGVFFHCQGTDDQTERALAVHHYPFREGGEIDDMGRKARPFSFNAVFWGARYQPELESFVAALDEGGEGELIHPVYGVKKVMVEQYSIKHDAENPDSCTVQITFRESGLRAPFFGGASTPKGLAQRAAGALSGALSGCIDAVSGAVRGVVADILASPPLAGMLSIINDCESVFQTVSGYISDAVGIAGTVMSYMDHPEAFVADLLGFAKGASGDVLSLINAEDYEPQAGFRAWQSLSSLFPGYSSAARPSKTYSTAPVTGDDLTRDTAPASAEQLAGTIADTPAGQVAAVVGTAAGIVQAAALADVVSALLIREAAEPVLSPGEIEAVVSNTRERLQDALELSRAALPAQAAYPVAEALRSAALAVQDLGLAVINARPPLTVITLDTPVNHHLLAHKLYGDAGRAAEILRLNPSIRLPNFLTPGQKVNVYAR
jgi:prophage DNA circulation protein